MQNVKVNNEFILEFNKALKKSYRKEYDAIVALYDNNKMNRTTLKKYYGLSGSNSTAVLNFFDFIVCNDKDLINAKPNNLSKIENNYLYKWFINFKDAYLTNKEKNTSKNKYIHITKEIVMKVKELLSLNIPQKEIKAKTEISLGSIYRIKKGIYDYMIENKQENNIEIKECNNIDEKESDNTIEINTIEKEIPDEYIPRKYNNRKLYSINYIKCGLIKNRHQMPVDLYIFNNTLLNNQILDYDYLDDTINKFIDEYIKFDNNGNALSALKIYTTGLQSALTSVIKICSERKIGLDVLHYDPEKNTYTVQKVFESYNLEDIIHLKGHSDMIYLFECSDKHLKNTDEIYECKFIVYKRGTSRSGAPSLYKESTISDKFNKILKFYYSMSKDLLNKNYDKILILRKYISKNDRENIKFTYDDQIIYSTNISYQ